MNNNYPPGYPNQYGAPPAQLQYGAPPAQNAPAPQYGPPPGAPPQYGPPPGYAQQPFAQPPPGGGALWAGMKDADPNGGGGNYLPAGFRGEVEITRTFAKNAFKGGVVFIAEFTVLSSNLLEIPVGMSRSWVQGKIQDPQIRATALGEIAGFIGAALGVDANDPAVRAQIERDMPMYVGPQNPLAGRCVLVETWNKPKRGNGDPFTKHKFSAVDGSAAHAAPALAPHGYGPGPAAMPAPQQAAPPAYGPPPGYAQPAPQGPPQYAPQTPPPGYAPQVAPQQAPKPILVNGQWVLPR